MKQNLEHGLVLMLNASLTHAVVYLSIQFAASMASCAGNISICYVHKDLFFSRAVDIYFCMYIITYRGSQAESGGQEQVDMRKSKAMEKAHRRMMQADGDC